MEEKTVIVIVMAILSILVLFGSMIYGHLDTLLPLVTMVLSAIVFYYFGKVTNSRPPQE